MTIKFKTETPFVTDLDASEARLTKGKGDTGALPRAYLLGGSGDDLSRGEQGNDLIVVNEGDGSDL